MSSAAVQVHHDQREDLTVYRPATFTLRWYALTLDLFFFAPLDFFVRMPFGRVVERSAAYGHEVQHWGIVFLLTGIPLLLYFIAPTALYGHTLGKKIVGLRVVTQSGEGTLRLRAVIYRETVGKLLSFASIAGVLAAAFGDRRAWHDRLSETRVIAYKE